MKEEIWHALPPEILERVLSFLPIPTLCQFRTVSKSWNALLSSPSFPTLNLQTYTFVLPDTVTDAVHGWDLYDAATHKTFHLSDAFLFHHVAAMERFQPGFQRSTIAADNGLFLVLWSTLALEHHALFLCNPVTKQSRELPFHGFFDVVVGIHNPVVLMSGSNIFLVEEEGPLHRMHLFDSTQWLPLQNPPQNLNPSSGVLFQNLLYILFWNTSSRTHTLYSYSPQTDEWRLEIEKLPKSKIPQLVVIHSRLFLLRAWAKSFSVVEIFLHQPKRTSTVSHMPRKLFDELVESFDELVESFDELVESFDETWSPYHDMIGRNASFVAVGEGDCLVVASLRGRAVVYDVVEGAWEGGRVHRQVVEGFAVVEEEAGLYGNSVRLSFSL